MVQYEAGNACGTEYVRVDTRGRSSWRGLGAPLISCIGRSMEDVRAVDARVGEGAVEVVLVVAVVEE